MKATNVADIAVLVEYVTLKDLKTKSGEAVVVRCEQPDALLLMPYLKGLPGKRPTKAEAEAMTEDQKSEIVKKVAPGLIEAGCVLEGPDGDVRPAFVFSGSQTPRHPLSLPGNVLSMEDLTTLAGVVGKLRGYGDDDDEKEAGTDPESFSGEHGSGVGSESGNLEAVSGGGTDAVGNPA